MLRGFLRYLDRKREGAGGGACARDRRYERGGAGGAGGRVG